MGAQLTLMGHVGISADRKTVGNACKNLEVIFGLERGVSQVLSRGVRSQRVPTENTAADGAEKL